MYLKQKKNKIPNRTRREPDELASGKIRQREKVWGMTKKKQNNNGNKCN